MKIAHAQLHMYTNIMYKFKSSTCKTVGEKLRTKLCLRTDRPTDRQMDSHGHSSITPLHFVVGGGGNKNLLSTKMMSCEELDYWNDITTGYSIMTHRKKKEVKKTPEILHLYLKHQTAHPNP